jgi:hypothetical protein
LAGALPKITVGVARDPRLLLCDRGDEDICLTHQIIEAPTCDGIATAINHDDYLEVVGGGDAPYLSAFQRQRVFQGVGFTPEYRNER